MDASKKSEIRWEGAKRPRNDPDTRIERPNAASYCRRWDEKGNVWQWGEQELRTAELDMA
jgi:hypothetical protein